VTGGLAPAQTCSFWARVPDPSWTTLSLKTWQARSSCHSERARLSPVAAAVSFRRRTERTGSWEVGSASRLAACGRVVFREDIGGEAAALLDVDTLLTCPNANRSGVNAVGTPALPPRDERRAPPTLRARAMYRARALWSSSLCSPLRSIS
jgi:ribosomal protein S30